MSRERLETMSSRAANAVERCAVTSILADVLWALQRPDLGIGACLGFLQHMGVDLPMQPTDAQARAAYDRVCAKLGQRSIEALADLPAMSDPAVRASMSVVARLATSAMAMGKNYFSVVILAGFELTLEHGNSDGASMIYAYAGIIIGWYFDDMQTALRLHRLALDRRKEQAPRK